ncbi:hypothetical protein BVRB_3g068230 [Beta vulgaris subsp. vulgaris]|uniref:uncharacterized protein LOC104906676 isoform X3 n=1 Tax=Beta vulgaris subsp. vulgaris TaxID=3555 RepID=UPI00053F9606|nr:uncharacterized protein LOC104906676 isoform X3 [Beta vulgaris subsp. vulgaris]KMS98843.1 hypothetical protein BVRB_3g068230 [Beta vulgaris subsp. vulgaris]
MSLIVLDELVQSLISKKGPEKLTEQEAAVFARCKSQVFRNCAIGGSVATGLSWMATRKLNSFSRLALAGGASFLTAIWSLHKSVDSCVDHILAMDGSRMQYELKKIILDKFGNDPEKMQLFSKHFYCEEVFNDSTPGQPKSYYRQRNLYVDDQRTADGSSSQVSDKKGVLHNQRNDDSNIKMRNPTAEIKQVPIISGIHVFGYGDPIDVLFGHSSPNEELHHPDESGNSAKVQSHRQRRARRRHKVRHRHQESFNLGVAQFQGA